MIQSSGLGFGEGVAETGLVGAGRNVDLAGDRDHTRAKSDIGGETGHG
jgi:hypothetical protein